MKETECVSYFKFQSLVLNKKFAFIIINQLINQSINQSLNQFSNSGQCVKLSYGDALSLSTQTLRKSNAKN